MQISSDNSSSKIELNKLQEEAFEHLHNGRNRIALQLAKQVFSERPDDPDAAICLAWALLENGRPAEAMDYANMAVELKGDSMRAHLYRGYILSKMSIFEGAVADLNAAIIKQREVLAWSYHAKAQSLAGMNDYAAAEEALDAAVRLDGGKHPEWTSAKQWFNIAMELENDNIRLNEKNVEKLMTQCEEAVSAKEYWFPLLVSRAILENQKPKGYVQQAELLELESMVHMYQIIPATEKAKKLREDHKRNERYHAIVEHLRKIKDHKEEDVVEKKTVIKKERTKPKNEEIRPKRDKPDKIKNDNGSWRTDAEFFPTKKANVFSARMFDVVEDTDFGVRRYYSNFDHMRITHIGVEVIFDNPLFGDRNASYNGKAVWYLNDFKIGANDFSLNVNKDWDSIIFAQAWGSDEEDYWKFGQGRVDIYIDGKKVCEKWFVCDRMDIIEKEKVEPVEEEPEDTPQEKGAEKGKEEEKKEIEPVDARPIEELLEELDGYVGLNSIKKSVRDFIAYLEFMKERKKLGLKAQEGISVNAAFLGNPGTGKTTIARIMGEIYKSMGILEKGHVIEVDRSGLVGQYVGETAQKAGKVIDDAMGGVLFIDEAYTLVKKGGGGQDFGQEAIDILLKKMEDKKGEFVVIAAGYPDEMETFLNSNPGMKSRFTHMFNFEDYTPDELMQIFDMLLKKEDYNIEDDAKEKLHKEFTNLYRKRDKTFGNARLVRKIFEDAKMQLSRRYLELDKEERNKEAMTTITAADIKAILEKETTKDVKLEIDEDPLSEAMEQINNLIGLTSVKKDLQDMIKLARFYIEQGEDVRDKFSSHTIFLGNPGTGKTTVARIFSKIYSALGILPKGHLVETDRQGLVSNHVGETAQKTTKMIDQSLGGTLFIDEAYTLSKKDGSDFGKEAIDTLLKRMEDDRGKFICIAAGYTNEMKSFIESNPGMQSRFTKTFTFEDYNPDELIEITERIIKSKKLTIEESALPELKKYYSEIYRKRDKNFGNARIVRNLVDSAQQKMMLRIADMPQEERNDDNTKTITLDDLSELISTTVKTKKYQIEVNQEKLEKYMKELNELTGLESVKRGVDKLISSLKVAKLRKKRGLKVIDKSLHSVFLGNPGTGKTTVARLLSQIYRELGLIEKGHLVEVDRSDLVAGYQGQTAIKTDKIIEQSLGGTLFIDEAYTLSRGPNDFGQEAIDTLLKKMEDKKGEFIVIAAGYPNEMKNFLDSNPGLQSRFTNFFDFEDYKPRQLLEISANIASGTGYKLDEGALQLLLEIFDNLYKNRDKNFGNARTAKNILYKAISNQEERITEMTEQSDEDLVTIIFEDVDKITENEYN